MSRGEVLGCQQTIHLEGLLPFDKCQLPLILQGLRIAFQADDEGSIPLTRSDYFNGFDGSHREIGGI
jgi:hypothetical protein